MELISEFEERYLCGTDYWKNLWVNDYFAHKNGDWKTLDKSLFQNESTSLKSTLFIIPVNWKKYWSSLVSMTVLGRNSLEMPLTLEVQDPFCFHTFSSQLDQLLLTVHHIKTTVCIGVVDCIAIEFPEQFSDFFSLLLKHEKIHNSMTSLILVSHLPYKVLNPLIRWSIQLTQSEREKSWLLTKMRIKEHSVASRDNVDIPLLFLVEIDRSCQSSGTTLGLSCVLEVPWKKDVHEAFPVFQLPRVLLNVLKERTQFCVINKLYPGRYTRFFCLEKGTRQKTYQITVYDTHVEEASKRLTGFLIPPGHEADWLFKSGEGLEEIANQCSTSRLIVISLVKSDTRKSQSDLQKHFQDMDTKIGKLLLTLVPEPRSEDDTFPILSLDLNEDSKRELKECVSSQYAGQIYIYDSPNDDSKSFSIKRCMVFDCNPRIIQTEVFVTQDGKVNLSASCSEYYGGILASLSFLDIHQTQVKDSSVCCLLLGLGGGVLAHCLTLVFQHLASKLSLTVVELDPMVVSMAQKWFDYPSELNFHGDGWTLCTRINDALVEIQDMENLTQDIIIIDINGDSTSAAVLCPSPEFLSVSFLKKAYDVLKHSGLLILNLATRSKSHKQQVYTLFQSFFSDCAILPTQHEINEIVVARKSEPDNQGTRLTNELASRLITSHIGLVAKALCGTEDSQFVAGLENSTWSRAVRVMNSPRCEKSSDRV